MVGCDVYLCVKKYILIGAQSFGGAMNRRNRTTIIARIHGVTTTHDGTRAFVLCQEQCSQEAKEDYVLDLTSGDR